MTKSPTTDASTTTAEPNETAMSGVPEVWTTDRTLPGQVQAWDDYWEQLDDKQPIFALEAGDYADRFTRAFPETKDARVLDFGCGFGFLSEAVSQHVGELVVWDSAANMRGIAYQRLSKIENVRFVDLSDGNEDARVTPFDFIVVNSVIQYMTAEDLHGWLERWKGLLNTDGRLVVSDIVTPDYSFIRDVVSYLYLCMRKGALLRSVWAGVKEIGNYSALKEARPLLKLNQQEIREAASNAGLSVEILTDNLTYHHGRSTAVFTAPEG